MVKIFRNKYTFFLLLIIIVGAFFRAYHFADWMHYELDQARDFRIVDAAVQYGPGELPLQGPRAAGSFLRLGPLFYYMEYGSALIFGNTPSGAATIVLILSVFSIPLFYVFARRFFSAELSFGLTALFGVSLFLVTYGRFAWNPNPVPFFALAFFYALLRAVDHGERRKGPWLVVAAVALAFLTQMHFLALAAAPLIGILFLLFTRPRIALRWWWIAIAAFLFFQIPLIVNDVKTGGENVQEFIEAVRGNATGEDRTLVENVAKNVGEHATYYWLILSGHQDAELPTIKPRGKGFYDVQCDQSCRGGLPFGILSFTLFGFGIIAMILLWIKEREKHKKQFLFLVFLWFGIIFAAYVPLAHDLAPRFFLIVAPIVFLLFGCILTLLFGSGNRQKIAWGALALFLATNLLFTAQYFSQLARANSDQSVEIRRDRILKEKTRMTLAQQETIVDYMEEKHRSNGFPIFMHGQAEFKRAFWERIEFRKIPRSDIPDDGAPLYRQGNYFLVIRTQSDVAEYMKKYEMVFSIAEKKIFGTLTVYHLLQKPEAITDEKKDIEIDTRDPKFSPGVQVRYLWRQVFEE